jgi:hypothetical protein
MKAKKTNNKVPKAQWGMLVAGALSAAPSVYAAIKGSQARKEAEAEANKAKALMPSMTSQEDYYNYYQKTAQSLNEAKMQNQLDQTLAAGSKTLAGAGTRGVLGGVQGSVGAAAQSKADITQQRQDKLLGAYEKMIGAKQSDREMVQGQIDRANAAATAGLQTELQALQNVGDISGAVAQGFIAKDGAVVKTPGEFSHKKNPIDIVRNGNKIAEMTGGEYIFNPKQMAAIKNLVGADDKSKLHSYMKKIIRTFEKRAVE